MMNGITINKKPMKTIEQIYDGFVTMTTNRKEGTMNIATFRDLTPGSEIHDCFGYKLLVTEVIDSWRAKGFFEDNKRPTVYKVKAKITHVPIKSE